VSTSATYVVTGMTCAHCVGAVTKEIEAIPGVESVAVSLDSARAVVTGAVEDDAVLAAVEEAGYAACRES
jgi:copper chaperone